LLVRLSTPSCRVHCAAVAMTGAHGKQALKAGGMAPGSRLRVRNNSPPSRRWYWDSACDMCRTLVEGGMCPEEARAGAGGEGEDIAGCCARAYVAPHVHSAFSVWQKSPRSVAFLELWRDLILARV